MENWKRVKGPGAPRPRAANGGWLAVLLGALGPGVAAAAAPASLVASPSTAASAPAASVESVRLRGGVVQVEVAGFADLRRVAQLRAWIDECVQATLTAYGRLPLPAARVRIAPSDRRDARSPVPWGQTSRRDGDVAVLLYVREDATSAELRADWTAVHELAHLFHPFLGDDGRWLAEGLASYYQNVLRARAGLMTQDDAWQRLHAGFGRGRREDSGLPLQSLGRRGTMRVYWAGAAFWLEADLALRARGSSLDDVLAQYSGCCLRGSGRVAPASFLADLDRIAGADVFTARHARFAAATAFPDLDAAYATLGLQPQAGGLRFSDAAEAAALRRAIMERRPRP